VARNSGGEPPQPGAQERTPISRPRRPGNLPLEALAALSQPHLGLCEGDVFWVPEQHLNYHSGKAGRFCVLVALETPAGSPAPTIGHLVVGSTSPEWDDSVPEIMALCGEGGLPEDTFFSFRMASSIDLALLREVGRYLDRLDQKRTLEMREAVLASTLVAVKRVLQK